jgi:hypothetical protein
MIDYYLKAKVSGPVTIEIVDPAGDVIRRYSSEDKPAAVNLETLEIPAYWVRTPKTVATSPGMHRWIWDLRPTAPPRPAGGGGGGGFGRGGAPLVLPGVYAVKLNVAGKTMTQSLIVRADPRSK